MDLVEIYELNAQEKIFNFLILFFHAYILTNSCYFDKCFLIFFS